MRKERYLSEQERTTKNVQYNPDFDTTRYREVFSLKQQETALYEEKRALLDGEVRFNLETALGERFNAGISRRKDRIVNGELYSVYSSEPMLQMFERGREYRFDKSSPHDRLREQAEVDSFQDIQAVLGDEETPIGTMLLLISPPGESDSIYKHNFYDIFTLQEEKGERYVDYRRYSSGLSRGEYIEKVATLTPGYFAEKEREDTPYDVYFLKRPIRIGPGATEFPTAQSLHEELHKAHDMMSTEEYEAMIHVCTPFITAYINTLAENPWALEKRNLSYNAILNKADEVVSQRARQRARGETILYTPGIAHAVSWNEVDRLGRLPVRALDTGCGFSEGMSVGSGSFFGSSERGASQSPFSVSEFGGGEDKYGKLTFKCPHCNHENKRPYNELIRYCQNGGCGKDVSC